MQPIERGHDGPGNPFVGEKQVPRPPVVLVERTRKRLAPVHRVQGSGYPVDLRELGLSARASGHPAGDLPLRDQVRLAERVNQRPVQLCHVARVAAEVTQPLTRQAATPFFFLRLQMCPRRCPFLLGLGALLGCRLLLRRRGWRLFPRECMPVGSDLAGLLHHPVRLRWGWPELQEVVVGLLMVLHPGVQFPGLIHPGGGVTDTVADLRQVERPVLLASPADQLGLAHGLKRRLNDLLPAVIYRRWLMVKLHREADLTGVQTGDQEQHARHGSSAQPVTLTAETLGQVRVIFSALDVDLPVVHPRRLVHQRAHRCLQPTPCRHR